MRCVICGAAALEEVPGFASLPRVTSDCKPFPAGGRLAVCGMCGAMQKYPDAAWRAEVAGIYRDFTLYHQADGAEQPVFDADGIGSPRSARLVEYLTKTLDLPERGEVLDFGCGNGAFLRAFGAKRPGWKLSGGEIDGRHFGALAQIPGFEMLFTVSPHKIAYRFDLITLVHSLEHLADPVGTLATLATLLKPGGHIFVQVPDCRRTPYDLVVADHLTHFTTNTLQDAAARAGLATTAIANHVVAKELTWIGRSDDRRLPTDDPVQPAAAAAAVTRAVAWLAQQIDDARFAASIRTLPGIARFAPSIRTRLGIFGTSISATWLYGALNNPHAGVAFFVDEDPARIGRRHMGLPVLSPAQIPEGTDVLMPLIPEAAAAVERRLARPGIGFRIPRDIA